MIKVYIALLIKYFNAFKNIVYWTYKNVFIKNVVIFKLYYPICVMSVITVHVSLHRDIECMESINKGINHNENESIVSVSQSVVSIEKRKLKREKRIKRIKRKKRKKPQR